LKVRKRALTDSSAPFRRSSSCKVTVPDRDRDPSPSDSITNRTLAPALKFSVSTRKPGKKTSQTVTDTPGPERRPTGPLHMTQSPMELGSSRIQRAQTRMACAPIMEKPVISSFSFLHHLIPPGISALTHHSITVECRCRFVID
jgi:hypothetical protein